MEGWSDIGSSPEFGSRMLLAERIGADPEQIILDKLAATREKYPVDKARGRSANYDALEIGRLDFSVPSPTPLKSREAPTRY